MKSLFATNSILWVTFFMFGLVGFYSLNAASNKLPGDGKPSIEENSKDGLPPGWNFQSDSDNPHAVIVVIEANPRINDIPLQPGDYIGAFYEDDFGELKCGGADEWNGAENIIFAVFGDDNNTPEKDGFSYNETMHFKVFYQDNNKAYDVTSISWDPTYYTTNKWSPLGLSSSTDMLCEVDFDAFITYDANPVCNGQSVNLEGNIFIATSGNYTWQWSSVPAGLNSNQQTVSHTPGEATAYLLQVFDGITTSTHELIINVNYNPTIYAGPDDTICVDQSTEVSAESNFSSSVLWSTAGDGTFQNPGSPSTVYYPGNNDQQNLSVELFATAFPIDPCMSEAIDSKTIQMTNRPALEVEETLIFCENQDILIEAEATLYDLVSWETSGDGTFIPPVGLSTQYYPGPSDLISNEFELTAIANAVSPCEGSVSDQVLVTLQDGATINAPTLKNACSNSPVTLNSLAFNYSVSLWTTEGDGTFLDPASLSTVYFPGPDDILNNGTTVTIHAFGTNLCETFDTFKNITINLMPLPEANAGPDGDACREGSVQLLGAAANSSFTIWGTTGDGYFDNPYITNPKYFPGTMDNNSGTVTLFLTAYAVYPCTTPTDDSLDILILPDPTVEIGSNTGSICIGGNYTFTDTDATYYSALEWFSINGTGTFDNPSFLNPTYYPDPEHDYLLGSVIIGVNALPVEPCTVSADDFFTLHFQQPATVDAGENDTIIQGETFLPASTASNFGSLLWETNGDGTFSDPLLLLPEYFPGSVDIQNYGVTITVTAFSAEPCDVSAIDSVSVFIYRNQQMLLSGGINSYSSYIDYEGKTFGEVMEPLGDNLIFAQQLGNVYWPEYGINTLEDEFDNSTGLKLILNNASEMQLAGIEISDKTVLLETGWNVLPVLSSCPIFAQQIYDLLGNDLIMILDIENNKFFMPENAESTLDQLVPGKSYMIKVTTESTFSFSDCE